MFVGVFVGVAVGVFVGVLDGVWVTVAVGDGVGAINTKQSGQSGSSKLYLFLSILKLCCTSEASKGSTYILKALISPIKLPPKTSSRNMFVVSPE